MNLAICSYLLKEKDKKESGGESCHTGAVQV